MRQRFPRLLSTTLLAGALATPALATDIDVSFTESLPKSIDHLVILMPEDTALTGDLDSLNDTTSGRLGDALTASKFSGIFGKSKTFYGQGNYAAITVLGTGDETLSRRHLHDIGGHIAKAASGEDSITVMAGTLDTSSALPLADLALGMQLGGYTHTAFKSEAEDSDMSVTLVGDNARAQDRAFDADYAHIATSVNLVRDLGNAPGRDIYPESFVQRMREAFRGVRGVKTRVYDLADLERLGMEGITGVGQGSIHDPRMMIVEYMGGGSEQPIALVGKGITFDTGGISIKGNTGMWLMKSDLSGAAAVGATVLAAAQRGAKINVVGLMPLAENMPAADAIRPGDVLNTYNGTTIEVMSTDAEGRLLLADAVAYAQDKYEPELLVNIATLTGSAGRALGDEYGAIVTRDFDLAQDMMDIGSRSGEDVWPLPLHANHYDQIKSDIADIKSTAGAPGASIGAAVVGTFVDESQPWVHIDMASVDWRDSATPTAPKGHSGWGVRFMDQILRDIEAEN